MKKVKNNSVTKVEADFKSNKFEITSMTANYDTNSIGISFTGALPFSEKFNTLSEFISYMTYDTEEGANNRISMTLNGPLSLHFYVKFFNDLFLESISSNKD